MSRTFRAYSAEFFPSYLRNRCGVPCRSLMRQLHRHWGDQRSGRRNAPRAFRKMLDRHKDARDKEALYNALVNDTELLSPIRKHNANWEYW
jgi:hypothetical protein